MITAILDTNVLVQSVIGPSSSASARAVDACHDEKYRLIYSPAILDEWIEVLAVPHIRQRHGRPDGELLEFLASLLVNAACHAGIALQRFKAAPHHRQHLVQFPLQRGARGVEAVVQPAGGDDLQAAGRVPGLGGSGRNRSLGPRG